MCLFCCKSLINLAQNYKVSKSRINLAHNYRVMLPRVLFLSPEAVCWSLMILLIFVVEHEYIHIILYHWFPVGGNTPWFIIVITLIKHGES